MLQMVAKEKQDSKAGWAGTTPCNSPINCVAHFSKIQAFYKNGDNKFNPDTLGRDQEENCLLKGFDKCKVAVGQAFDGLARHQNQQMTINKTSASHSTSFCPQLIISFLWTLILRSTADFWFI
jgi:hypothetical protein